MKFYMGQIIIYLGFGLHDSYKLSFHEKKFHYNCQVFLEIKLTAISLLAKKVCEVILKWQ